MTAVEIITRKRNGNKLTNAEIDFFIGGYTRGEIPDYQMSALLMAIYFTGMDADETATLTRLMRDSGKVLDLGVIPGPKVDKHSTGGVGDKVSLVLAPLVAACGIVDPMISGRSLAHTGGTLDKLEAIPGFNTQLDLATFIEHLRQRGVSMIGQTPQICPADKKIYALRDATATVESIPLICGSILSKKLAENLDALVLDVKCGSGAIFADPAYSERLAHALVRTADEFGLQTVALLTQMDQPLGRAIGTWLETREAIEMLCGQADKDFYEVTVVLSAYMVLLGGRASSYTEARKMVEKKLADGVAMRIFREVIAAQGGDLNVVDHPDRYLQAKHEHTLRASSDGFVHAVQARTLGQTAMRLGAGRSKKEDGIDYTAGILLHKKVGSKVQKDEPLATLFASQQPIAAEVVERASAAFTIAAAPVESLPAILGVIDIDGKHGWSSA